MAQRRKGQTLTGPGIESPMEPMVFFLFLTPKLLNAGTQNTFRLDQHYK